MFNSPVMGFVGSTWMWKVSNFFDAIAKTVVNSFRLQEECDVLSLRIGKVTNMNLPNHARLAPIAGEGVGVSA